MGELFLKVVNMSISASWLILAVVLLRLALKKSPKWISCVLWALVAVRLTCPISLESAWSLIPNAEPIPFEIFMAAPPESHGNATVAPVINPNLPEMSPMELDATIDMLQTKHIFPTLIWMIGVAVMVIYAAFSYIRLRHKVKASLLLQENIWLCDEIATPFLLGFFSPRIYIPSGIEENQMTYIIAHENAHLRRKDHWWKPLGYLVLAVHWFHPLVWLAYILFCRDIELACDEKVIRNLDRAESIAYSEALLSYSVSRRTMLVCPLTFGEVGVKERVKRVLNYKKPAFWVVIGAVVACVILAVCFLTNPKGPRAFPMSGHNISALDPNQILAGICNAEGLEEPSSLHVNMGNFDLVLTNDFDLAGSGAIRFFYTENQKTYSSQLRLFVHENQYFVTERTEWPEQKQVFSLRGYLEALQYLPQDEICKLSPDADTYSVLLQATGTPEDFERVVTYTAGGAGRIAGWNIHLEVQPNHKRDGAYYGSDDEVIHVFYGTEADDTSRSKLADSLLATICSSPAASSNPGDYIREHQNEYNELLKYNVATLRYCFSKFLEGGQTDLRGHIMASLCKDIMVSLGEPVLEVDSTGFTGQDWFDAFYANAKSLADKYSPNELEKNCPASWLLWQMDHDLMNEMVSEEEILTGKIIKTYQYTGDNIEKSAVITLYDNKEFQFVFSPLSSYLGYGHYTIEDGKLTLNTSDGKFTYVFEMVDNLLVFDADASSKMVWFSGLEDGSVLYLSK